MAPPSGADTLQVRQTYLRKRRSRHVGTWQRTAVWVVAGATACWLCIAGFTVFENCRLAAQSRLRTSMRFFRAARSRDPCRQAHGRDDEPPSENGFEFLHD